MKRITTLKYRHKKRIILAGLMAIMACQANAQAPKDSLREDTLSGVTVVTKQTTRRNTGAINATSMLRSELFKAACCNLGESFVNNPSVDVNYSDAATGAKELATDAATGAKQIDTDAATAAKEMATDAATSVKEMFSDTQER